MGNALNGHAMARRLELRRENRHKEEEEMAVAEEQKSGKQ
jgi:hypothetical protein